MLVQTAMSAAARTHARTHARMQARTHARTQLLQRAGLARPTARPWAGAAMARLAACAEAERCQVGAF